MARKKPHIKIRLHSSCPHHLLTPINSAPTQFHHLHIHSSIMSSSSSSLQWLSLVATIWLQIFNGPNTDFPVYSSELKELKSISQIGINFLAFAFDAGKLFGWISGLAAIYLPPWLVAATGAVLGLLGYGLQFLFLDHPKFSYAHIFALTAVAGNGVCWINTACYLVCIKNFAANSRRVAVGLSTSYVGLSAKVFTIMAGAIFHGNLNGKAKHYLFLNSIVPVLVSLIVAPFMRFILPCKNVSNLSLGFIAMFTITFATGVSAIIGTIGSTSQGFFTTVYPLSLGILLASLLVVPLAVKLKHAMEETLRNKKEKRIHDLDDAETGVRTEELRVKEEEDDEVDEGAEGEESDGVGGFQILRKMDFWLYFFSYLFSATLGLVFLNNLGQIAESRGLPREETSTLVSLSSAFGFFGRLFPFLIDYYSSKRSCMISRQASMATLMAPMAVAFFVLANPTRLSLYMSTAAIGAFTGAITSIAVSATTELFGTKHFSINHNIVVANIPLGSFVFGYLAALLYKRGAEGNNSCRGDACYGKTFLIWGATCSLGSLLCTILYMRTRNKVP